MIVPQDPGDPTRAYPEQQLQKDYPKTYGYLKRFERELRNRSGYQQILSRREREFYGVMDIRHLHLRPLEGGVAGTSQHNDRKRGRSKGWQACCA